MFSLLYKSLVRPHLEYASPAWNPTFKMDVNSIERVQRRATHLVPSLSSLSYEDRLRKLHLPTLQFRRLRTDLLLLYKISHNMSILNTDTFCTHCKHNTSMLTPALSHNTRGHNYKFQIHHHQGIRNRFFTSKCLTLWNTLTPNTVNSTSINNFKHNLGKDSSMPDQFILT